MPKPIVPPEPETDPDADIFDEDFDDDDIKDIRKAAAARRLATRLNARDAKPPEKKKRRGFLS